jgi:hypothetical protein
MVPNHVRYQAAPHPDTLLYRQVNLLNGTKNLLSEEVNPNDYAENISYVEPVSRNLSPLPLLSQPEG